jgi:hypothetical protein
MPGWRSLLVLLLLPLLHLLLVHLPLLHLLLLNVLLLLVLVLVLRRRRRGGRLRREVHMLGWAGHHASPGPHRLVYLSLRLSLTPRLYSYEE